MSSDATASLCLVDYYKHFKSLFGALASLVTLLPLGALLGQNSYVFPPLGGEAIERSAILMTVIFSLCTTLFVYFAKNTFESNSGGPRKRTLAILLLAAVISFAIYVMLHTVFVRDIRIPAKNQVVAVSVGRHRNPKNPKEYAQMSDEDMLRDAGPEEDSIRRLFTTES